MNAKSPDTRRRPLWLPLMEGLWGLIMCALVGADGPPMWRIFRIAIVAVVTAVVILLTMRFPRWGAVIAILLSSLALTLGIAFGLYWLMKAGFSWRVAVGLLSIVVWGLLLVLGSRQLVSGISRWWLFLTIPLTVIIVPFLAWTIMPAVLATNEPPIMIGDTTPQDYGLSAQEVSFKAADGVELGGWYIPSVNRGAVVLRHGSGSTGSDVLAQAAVLAKHGYGVLITDARGHGLSSGKAMDFGWYGDADISGAVDFLVDQPDVDPSLIAIVGLSMGGEEAIGAAAADSRIVAVVAEGATGRTDADKAWMKDIYGFQGSIQMGLEWAEYSITDMLTGAGKPIALIDAVKDISPHPVMLITAGEVEDELHAAEYMQQGAPDVTIWTIPGAGHTQGLSVAPAEWEKRVIGFLDTAMGF
jgi:uncharacterized protein